MATCPNCRTYTDDERAKGSEPFVCRKCQTPLSLNPVEPAGKKGKGSKGGKGAKGKKGKPASVGVMMPLESDVPLPKKKSEDEDSPKKPSASDKSSEKPARKKIEDEDEDDLPPKPKMPPPPPPKASLLDGPVVLVGIGVVCFVLGLAVGVLVL